MNNISEAKFASCGKPQKYKKLLFAMCWFHAVLVDRRKVRRRGLQQHTHTHTHAHAHTNTHTPTNAERALGMEFDCYICTRAPLTAQRPRTRI